MSNLSLKIVIQTRISRPLEGVQCTYWMSLPLDPSPPHQGSLSDRISRRAVIRRRWLHNWQLYVLHDFLIFLLRAILTRGGHIEDRIGPYTGRIWPKWRMHHPRVLSLSSLVPNLVRTADYTVSTVSLPLNHSTWREPLWIFNKWNWMFEAYFLKLTYFFGYIYSESLNVLEQKCQESEVVIKAF